MSHIYNIFVPFKISIPYLLYFYWKWVASII